MIDILYYIIIKIRCHCDRYSEKKNEKAKYILQTLLANTYKSKTEVYDLFIWWGE